MIAYQFLAHDRAGLTLKDVTDNGYCIWEGTEEQKADAQFYEAYFEKFGEFPAEADNDDYYVDAKYDMI